MDKRCYVQHLEANIPNISQADVNVDDRYTLEVAYQDTTSNVNFVSNDELHGHLRDGGQYEEVDTIVGEDEVNNDEENEMLDKDRGKAKVSKSRPPKHQRRPPHTTSTAFPTSSSSPALSPAIAPLLRTSAVPVTQSPAHTTSTTFAPSFSSPSLSSQSTPSSGVPGGQSPPNSQPSHRNPNIHHVVPPTELSPHSHDSSNPIVDGGLAHGTSESRAASETPNSTGKTTLYLDGQGFLPSRPAANGIADIFKSHYTDPWPSWKKIPPPVRDLWFDEFMRKFSIIPPNSRWARKNFDMRGAALMKNNLEKARAKMEKPSWIGESTILNGTAPTPAELFRRTHQHKDNTWVDRRSAHIDAEFTRTWEQLTQQASEQGTLPPMEFDVWRDVAECKKGRIYGLGLESTVVCRRPYYQGSGSSSTEWVRREEFQELRKERDELLVKLQSHEKDIQMNNQMLRTMMEQVNLLSSKVQVPLIASMQEAEDDEE
ncbi:putative transposase, Ptta/En/Spm, plant [Sesbania bispinosa]|nr:putative transposase, Ptta/En/Spm, plant [Sesbania bispinosa]